MSLTTARLVTGSVESVGVLQSLYTVDSTPRHIQSLDARVKAA